MVNAPLSLSGNGSWLAPVNHTPVAPLTIRQLVTASIRQADVGVIENDGNRIAHRG